MAKLRVESRGGTEDDAGRRQVEAQTPPTTRRCPKCLVTLTFERTRRSRGLNGIESALDLFVCPACDTRFQHDRRDGRWREVE